MQFKRVGILFLIPLFTTVFLAVFYLSASAAVPEVANLVITEVMASNATALEDPNDPGDYPDWFEIYNAGALAVDLNGFHFSDDPTDPNKHQITQTLVIAPNSYLVLYADKDPQQGAQHLDFKLGSGETVLVVDIDGTTVLDSYAYREAVVDSAEYRCTDAPTEWRITAIGTPGIVNGACAPVISSALHLPVAPGASNPVAVSATITDLASVSSALLWYDAGSGFVSTTMATTSGGYQGTIPAQPLTTLVNYYIEATNSSGVTALNPHTAPATTHTYQVGYVTPTIRINEFMASNATVLQDPADPSSYPDWIEIHNFGASGFDLNGITLQTLSAQYVVSQSVVIPANGYYIFYADNQSAQGIEHTNFKLPSGGDTISLIDSNGTNVIDSYAYGAQTADVSARRCRVNAAVWGFDRNATPNAQNGFCGPVITNTNHAPTMPGLTSVLVSSDVSDNGTVVSAEITYRVNAGAWMTTTMSANAGTSWVGTIPAQTTNDFVEYYVSATDNLGVKTYDALNAPANSYSYYVNYTPPTIYLNEIVANNDTLLVDPAEPTEYPDWIELYNPATTAVNLQGLYLTDDVSDPASYYQITGTLMIPAGGYLMIYADDDSEQGLDHTTFKLSSSGETLALIGLDGVTVLDSHTFGAQAGDDVIGRIPDGTGAWSNLDCATPAMSNSTCNSRIYLPIIIKQ